MSFSEKNRAHTHAALGEFRFLLWMLLFVGASLFTNAADSSPTNTISTDRVLKTVDAVRKLSRDQTVQKIPVRLSGVITYWGPRWHCFLHDETGGIFLNVKLPEQRDPSEPTMGDLVEVTGVTGPGDFAPLVEEPVIRKVAKGVLPKAKEVALDRLMEGQEDSQFVQVSGVVRRVTSESDHMQFEIATSNGRFIAICPDLGTVPPVELIDCLVTVRGACGTLFNQKGQLRGVQICFHADGGMKVIRKGASNPFFLPVTQI